MLAALNFSNSTLCVELKDSATGLTGQITFLERDPKGSIETNDLNRVYVNKYLISTKVLNVN